MNLSNSKTGYVFKKDNLYFWWDAGRSACDYGWTPNFEEALFISESKFNWYKENIPEFEDWMLVEGYSKTASYLGRCKIFLSDSKLVKVTINTSITFETI